MILDSFRLDGRLAVVTGGAGLYGSLIARALAEAGAELVVTSRDPEKARGAAADLVAAGHRAHGAELDLSEPASIRSFVAETERQAPIDVLVNNAVHRQGAGLFDTTADDWEATSRVNSQGTFLLTRSVVAAMADRGRGSVVFIGSIYGLVAPDFSIYAGTDMTSPVFYSYDKAGMVGMTKYLASALGPRGVRVNCLCLGGLHTDQDPEFVERYAARTPLGRMAEPGDVEGPVVHLASDASRYITGAVIPVDGGWTCR